MTTFNSFMLVIFASCTSIQGMHRLCHNAACFDTDVTQVTVTFDSDDILYVDFNKQTVVWESRVPTALHSLYTFSYALEFKSQCKFHLERWKRDTSISKITVAPEVLIYPRDNVIEQIDNTLICLVRHFFPPTIKIKWTKNREVVASDDPFEKMLPGSDGTFLVFSRLSFVPKDGDIYACIVEHEALGEPIVRFFEFHSRGTYISPTAYCVVCIILGLIGFSAGIFIFFKDDQHQQS